MNIDFYAPRFPDLILNRENTKKFERAHEGGKNLLYYLIFVAAIVYSGSLLTTAALWLSVAFVVITIAGIAFGAFAVYTSRKELKRLDTQHLEIINEIEKEMTQLCQALDLPPRTSAILLTKSEPKDSTETSQ